MSNVLLGGAIGDSLGMPFEKKLVNDPLLVNWDGRTFLSCAHHNLQAGQFTDDSQMQQIVAESLLDNKGFSPDDISARYVDWMASGRARGWGRTTLMSIQNLQAGRHWSESGIAGSEGNGSAMRSAPFGVYFRNDLQSLVQICKIDSAITHASPDAEAGSIAVAVAAYYAVNNDLDNLLEKICLHLPESKVKNSIFSLDSLINSENITPSQALRVLGTKANVKETVPSVLYTFLKIKDYHKAIETIIRSGGDTDTGGAILGALIGARDGIKVIDKYFHKVESFDKLVELDSQLYNRSSQTFFPVN